MNFCSLQIIFNEKKIIIFHESGKSGMAPLCWIFWWLWLCQIVNSESNWDNNHYWVHFCHFQKLITCSCWTNDPKWTKVHFEFRKLSFLWKCIVFLKWTLWWLLSQVDSGLTIWVRWVSQIHRKSSPYWAAGWLELQRRLHSAQWTW